MTEIKAVIPTAGFGTRFLPLTKAQPKEMLPVVDRPTIQWVVEEAVEAVAEAAAAAPPVSEEMFTINNVWMMGATFLVFIMHLGFATLEPGLTRQKNTVNILFKNVSIIAIGLLTYAIVGFNLMYPGEFNGFIGFAGFGLSTAADYTPIGDGKIFVTDIEQVVRIRTGETGSDAL